MNENTLDHRIRIATFDWLSRQIDVYGDVLPRSILAQGFDYHGTRIPLVSPQGIFKPKILDIPLSITTTPNSPYSDRFGDEGFLEYSYRGTDPGHPDNVGLNRALLESKPLVYFHGFVPGKYVAIFPVYVIANDVKGLTFTVAADDMTVTAQPVPAVNESSTARRQYITTTVKRRLHQQGFRERVLRAYREQCSLCRLKHTELLDAAHIIPDTEPEGLPVVPNGITLCKLHHAAYDRMVLGISPDYRVEIRKDVLEEIDGPMLKHGLVEMHGSRLILPRSKKDWPDQERLERRYELFKG